MTWNRRFAISRRVFYSALLGAILIQAAIIANGLFRGMTESQRVSQSPSVALGNGFGTNTSYSFLISPSRIRREPGADHVITVTRDWWHSTVVCTERARWGYPRGLSGLLDQLILWSPPLLDNAPGWSIGHEVLNASNEWSQLSELGVGWPFRGVVWRWHVTIQHPDRPLQSYFVLLPLPGKALDDPGWVIRPWRLTASLVVTWGLLVLPLGLMWRAKTIRSWIRRWRGLCESCCYLREGLVEGAPCPECGEPAPKARPIRDSSAPLTP